MRERERWTESERQGERDELLRALYVCLFVVESGGSKHTHAKFSTTVQANYTILLYT